MHGFMGLRVACRLSVRKCNRPVRVTRLGPMQCGGLVPAARLSTTRPVRADVDEEQDQSTPPKEPEHDPVSHENAAFSSAIPT